MRWTCPKCGKKLEISNEQIIANDGVIVCPQCLLQARQPIPKARIKTRDDNPSQPTAPQNRNIDFDPDTPPEYKPTTPPPHKTRMKQASTSYRYTGLSGDQGSTSSQSPTTKKKTIGKKKSKKKKKSEGMSSWGCLLRSIIFTLVLFAAYVFFGLLLEALQ